MDEALHVRPIGTVRSPWPERFGIPRQAGLADADATIELLPERCPPDALRGLANVSHLWVLWWAHAAATARRPTVRPPRLGGNARLGVFATRSPVRPNPIGLSAVRLLGIDGTRVHIRGGDLLDGTPVLDLKPYVPWCDAIPDACAGWADAPPRPREVRIAPAAERVLAARPHLRALVVAMLASDPRPAYRTAHPDDHVYGMRVHDLDVRFVAHADALQVIAIDLVTPTK